MTWLGWIGICVLGLVEVALMIATTVAAVLRVWGPCPGNFRAVLGLYAGLATGAAWSIAVWATVVWLVPPSVLNS